MATIYKFAKRTTLILVRKTWVLERLGRVYEQGQHPTLDGIVLRIRDQLREEVLPPVMMSGRAWAMLDELTAAEKAVHSAAKAAKRD
jgi:hypothetical protein